MQTNNTIVILFAQTFPAAFNTAAFAGKTNVTEAIKGIVWVKTVHVCNIPEQLLLTWVHCDLNDNTNSSTIIFFLHIYL